MVEEYRVFLENLLFTSFPKLMEEAKRTNESVKKTSNPSHVSSPNPVVRQLPRKGLIMVVIEMSKESGPSNSEKPSYCHECKQEKKTYLVLSPFRYDIKKAHSLLSNGSRTQLFPRLCVSFAISGRLERC